MESYVDDLLDNATVGVDPFGPPLYRFEAVHRGWCLGVDVRFDSVSKTFALASCSDDETVCLW